MGGLYGSMLTYFSGQLRPFTYFNMTSKLNSGYTIDPNVPVQTFRGVLQNSTSDVFDSNGNLAINNNEFLWARADLQVGYFVKFGTDTFRIIPSNDWTFEGGFTRYTVSRLIGDNGTPDTNNYTAGLGGVPL